MPPFVKGQAVRVTFTAGERQGEVVEYPLRVEPSDERGVTFNPRRIKV